MSIRRFSPSGSAILSIDRSACGHIILGRLPIIVLDLCDQIAELLLRDFLVTQPKRVSKVQFDKREQKIYPFNIIIYLYILNCSILIYLANPSNILV